MLYLCRRQVTTYRLPCFDRVQRGRLCLFAATFGTAVAVAGRFGFAVGVGVTVAVGSDVGDAVGVGGTGVTVGVGAMTSSMVSPQSYGVAR